MKWMFVLSAVLATSSCSADEAPQAIQSQLAHEATGSNEAATTFSPYTETPLRNGSCIVGTVADEDGMNQRPVVRRLVQGTIAWHRPLPMSPDFYQGRATHCLEHGDRLYVLYQIDTQSAQTLSQTLVKIARLKVSDGGLETVLDVDVPGVAGAYSAWVHDHGDFAIRGKKLLVSGSYFLMRDEDREHKRFSVEIPLSN